VWASQKFHRLVRNAFNIFLHAFGAEITKWRPVVRCPRTFPQRRETHREHVQTIIEITSELPVRHHLRQVATRGATTRTSTRVVCVLPSRSNSCSGAPAITWAAAGRNVADLVQEKRAAIREFETSNLSRDSSGERPPLMAEQFALEQSRGNRGAIHSHEWPVTARTSIVDGASDEFLARPCLTEDENRGIGRSHDFDLIEPARSDALRPMMSSNLSSGALAPRGTSVLDHVRASSWLGVEECSPNTAHGRTLTPALSFEGRGNRVRRFCESRFVDGIAGDTCSFRGELRCMNWRLKSRNAPGLVLASPKTPMRRFPIIKGTPQKT